MADKPREALLFRERKGNPTGQWSPWKLAELGIPSLLAKAQDRPDEYEVAELVEKPPPPEGLVVSIDLGQLWTEGNVDDRILGIVAARLLEDVDREARESVSRAVRDVRQEVIREHVEPIIREALEKPMQPTNQYGEPRPGADPVTLPELIDAEVKKFMEKKAGYSSSREGTELDRMIEEAVGRQFKSELSKAVSDAKAKALDKVREAAGDVIAESVRRAGGML
jgi:hypothetical protein